MAGNKVLKPIRFFQEDIDYIELKAKREVLTFTGALMSIIEKGIAAERAERSIKNK